VTVRVGILAQVDLVLGLDGVFLDVAQDAEDLLAIEVDDCVDLLALGAYRRLHKSPQARRYRHGRSHTAGSGPLRRVRYWKLFPLFLSRSIAHVDYLPVARGLEATSSNNVGLSAFCEPAPVPGSGRELAVKDFEFGPARRIEGPPHDFPGRMRIQQVICLRVDLVVRVARRDRCPLETLCLGFDRGYEIFGPLEPPVGPHDGGIKRVVGPADCELHSGSLPTKAGH